MATAKNRNQSDGLVFIAGIIVLLPLLLVSIIGYYTLKSRYPENTESQRVFDVGNLSRPFMTAGLLIALSWMLIAWTSKLPGSLLIQGSIIAFAAFVLFKIAQSISSTYLGVIIDPNNDRLLLPKDMANYSLTDYLSLRFITELGTVEQVPLSQIKRITRQAGTKLFIHGKFGSRGIHFSTKQKRDECISAIEEGSSAALKLEFENS